MSGIDDILKESLSPNDEVGMNLKKNILNNADETKSTESRKPVFTPKRLKFAVIAFAVILAAAAFTVWRLQTAGEVAEHMENHSLAEAFHAEDAWNGNEVQHAGGYDVTFLGLVSGENLSDFQITDNGKIITDGTYAVVAIRRSDSSEPALTLEEPFLVSPYIQGYKPVFYNIITLGAGGYTGFEENGVIYRLIHTANIEAFADRKIYLGISDGTFYNDEAFVYDPESGELSRNEEYDGLNALFILNIDPSKANPDKAAEIIRRAEGN